ncbi:MAG TPA: hypothetical protein VGP93_01210, partial [Polyangiaceae bacterium]|nr:hypothetical protein [Polyangiaceae bacterium]
GADVIRPFVIGGDLTLLSGLDCTAAVVLAEQLMQAAMPALPGAGGAGGSAGALGVSGAAGAAGVAGAAGDSAAAGAGGAPEIPLPPAPALRVRELPALPAGTLNGGLSYLFVAAGCLGGPWYTDDDDDKVCGVGYEGGTTLVPILVSMSRETALQLGLQALHASRAAGEIDVRVLPPDMGVDPITIASDLSEGEIAPRPALSEHSRFEWGIGSSGFEVQLMSSGTVQLAEPWDLVLAHGELDDAEDGQNYVLLALGPEPGIGLAKWWNKSVISIVPSDPPTTQ